MEWWFFRIGRRMRWSQWLLSKAVRAKTRTWRVPMRGEMREAVGDLRIETGVVNGAGGGEVLEDRKRLVHDEVVVAVSKRPPGVIKEIMPYFRS